MFWIKYDDKLNKRKLVEKLQFMKYYTWNWAGYLWKETREKIGMDEKLGILRCLVPEQLQRTLQLERQRVVEIER